MSPSLVTPKNTGIGLTVRCVGRTAALAILSQMLPRALVTFALVAAMAAGCGGGDDGAGAAATPLAPAQTRTLREKVFTTSVPQDWHQRKVTRERERVYFLNSGRGHANGLGLAAPGEVGLTIARQRATSGQSALTAIETIVATPDNAVGVIRSRPIKAARLGGAEAATTQFTYTLGGATYIQSNLVAVNGDTLIFIEVDVEPLRAADGERVLSTVTQSWRWRGGEPAVAS